MLYVASQADIEDPRALIRLADSKKVSQWLYIGDDSAWRILAEQALGSRIRRQSIAQLLDDTAWRLRQPYIDWIGELSQINDSLEWWASGLAEKNPFARLYVRICLLASAMELIKDGLDRGTLIICSGGALFDQVVRFASASDIPVERLGVLKMRPGLRRLGRWGRRRLRTPYRGVRRVATRLTGKVPPALEGDPAYRRAILARRGFAPVGDFAGDDAILVFTWVDRRNFTPGGRYHDPYLNRLPDMLRDRGYRVAYVPRVLPGIPFEEAIDRLLKTGEQVFFPELFVTPEDIERARQCAHGYQPTVPADSQVGDVSVHELAMEQVEQDRHGLAETLVYDSLIANLSRAGVKPRQIIHTCEGHRWERVLARAVRRHMPGTLVVGYDPGTYSRLQLSLFQSSRERCLRPLPDRVVTNGPLPRDTLATDGLPPEIVRAGCAIRYPWDSSPAANEARSDRDPKSRPIRVLVATSVTLGDSVEHVAKAAQAFGGRAMAEVVVKCHPLVDTQQVVRRLGRLVSHKNLRFTDRPIPELLPSMDILLYTYTTVAFEALRHGVVPIFVRAENALNLDKLEGVPEVRWVATTPEELRRVVAEIVGMTAEERQAWQERAEEALQMAFAPITPECVDAFIV